MARKQAPRRSKKPVPPHSKAVPYEAAHEKVPRVFDRERAGKLARDIKLPPSVDLRRFEEDIHAAVRWCLHVHYATRFRRPSSEVRETLDKISRHLSAAARKLRPLLDSLPWPMFFYGHPSKPSSSLAEDLDANSQAFRRLAETFAGKGGRLKHYPAFDALVAGLAQAFQRAAGRPAGVTWHEYRGRYEGQFLELVKALLPEVQHLARAATGQPLSTPRTPMALGKSLQRLTERMDKSPRR